MSIRSASLCAVLAATASAALPLAAAADTDDRLTFTGNASALTDDHAGGGGAAGWIHNFTDSSLFDVEGEYEALANAHWEFGSLSASTSFGPADGKLSLSAEAHEGAGHIGAQPFDYRIEAAGIARSFGTQFSLQAEDRQFDVDTTHGNLPKLGASYAWTSAVSTGVAYAHTVSGNLGTNLLSLRIDTYSKSVNVLAGGAFGTASPAVLNLETGVIQPGKRLNEGFLGFGTPLSNGKLTVVADYLDLAGIRRATLTVSYIFDLGTGRQRR
jgi:hypothetical protein